MREVGDEVGCSFCWWTSCSGAAVAGPQSGPEKLAAGQTGDGAEERRADGAMGTGRLGGEAERWRGGRAAWRRGGGVGRQEAGGRARGEEVREIGMGKVGVRVYPLAGRAGTGRIFSVGHAGWFFRARPVRQSANLDSSFSPQPGWEAFSGRGGQGWEASHRLPNNQITCGHGWREIFWREPGYRSNTPKVSLFSASS